MADLVVYHNPDSMGYPATEVVTPVVLTNKRISRRVVGSRLWLLTGEGQPRRYFLRATFLVTEVEASDAERFRTRISGQQAQFFAPMIDLTDEDWFAAFRRGQGNFAFGCQVIRDPRACEGLRRAASVPSAV